MQERHAGEVEFVDVAAHEFIYDELHLFGWSRRVNIALGQLRNFFESQTALVNADFVEGADEGLALKVVADSQ